MTRERYRRSIASVCVFWLGLTASPALLAQGGWQELEHSSLDALFASSIRSETSYRVARLDPVSIWFPVDGENAAAQAEALRLRTGERFELAIAARGLTIDHGTDYDSLNGVVVVRVQLIDLRTLSGDAKVPAWADQFRFPVAPGRVTLVAELIDAATGRTVVRMADLQARSSGDATMAIDTMLQSWGNIVALHAETLPGLIQAARAR